MCHDQLEGSSTRGVRLTRRTALRGALAVPAWMALAAATTAGTSAATSAANAPVSGARVPDDDEVRADEVAAFLDTWQQRANAAVATGSTDDDGLLHALLAELSVLGVERLPGRQQDAYSSDDFTSGPIAASPTFLVLEFELAPNAVITPHNHVGFSFVSVGVEGEATVRHYEPEAGAPSPRVLDTPFDLREVQRTLLTRGRSSSLSRTRANIHAFRGGPEGARFIDFGVHYETTNGGYEVFSKLDIDEAASDPARGIHTARWIGNPKS